MWKKWTTSSVESTYPEYHIDDFKALLRYVNFLASHKLGYPVSLLTYLGILNNSILGIMPGSLANVLLNNVGDPFKDSETSLLEVKQHERDVIRILEKYYGLPADMARGYVTTGGTEGNFAALWWSKRYVINLQIEKLIHCDDEVKFLTQQFQETNAALKKITYSEFELRVDKLQKLLDINESINQKKNIIQQILTPTVFFTNYHTHYSVAKIAEILHLYIKPIESNSDGSMNLNNLKKEMLLLRTSRPHSSVIIIANIGTTVTGAIDDVPAMRTILDASLPDKNYTIHMDGALTGFVLPILKPFGKVDNYFDAIGANTLAVSAHKYPGLSQPCGILLAHKIFFDKAFEKSERNIDYVGNISDVTISGSRSGLNVLMLHHALSTLGLHRDQTKLAEMVKENISVAKFLRDELIKIYGDDQVYYPHHFNVMFPRPSKELARKYQLMITGDRATICVLPNVSKSLIKEFLTDLVNDKEQSMNSSSHEDFTIETLQAEHIPVAVEVFTKSFCDSEPITKYLNIHYSDYKEFARDVIQKAVKEGLSKVALNKSNRVIACAIAEDMADPFVPHPAHYPKIKPVFDLLTALSAPFLQGKRFVSRKILHMWVVAVEQSFRGKGVSTQLSMACIENAARKGFDYAYAEFTNEISEKVTSQFKVLKLLNRIIYDEFVSENGLKPFQGLEGSASAYVAAIRPGVNLDSLSNCYQVTEKY